MVGRNLEKRSNRLRSFLQTVEKSTMKRSVCVYIFPKKHCGLPSKCKHISVTTEAGTHKAKHRVVMQSVT